MTRNPRKDGSGIFRYIDVDALDNERNQIERPKELPSSEAPSRARRLVRSGDVLFSLVRPYLRNIAMVPEDLDGAVASTAYCVLRPLPGLDSRFLFYHVLSESFVKSVPTHGNSPPSARQDEFLDLAIPFAPPSEQRRIVATIEELFSELDAGTGALERARAKLEQYRASVLKAAVEGRLTEEWRQENPPEETGQELLERILAERRVQWERNQLAKYEAKGKKPPKNWQARYEEPVSPDTSGLPTLPENWAWGTVDQVAGRITSGSRDWKPFYGRGSGVFILAQNVRPGRLDLSHRQLVDPPVDDPSRSRSQVAEGDVLVTIVGANTGDVCRVPTPLREHYVCQSVALVRPAHAPVSRFLELALRSPLGQEYFAALMYGQGRPHLSFVQLASTPIPLPPVNEQEEITRVHDTVCSQRGEAAAALDAQMNHAETLRRSILSRAFQGRLVPQDPRDEPAAVTLERIRTRRTTASPTRRRRRDAKSGHLGLDF